MIDSSQSQEGDRHLSDTGAVGPDPMSRPDVWPRSGSARRASRSGPPPARVVAAGSAVEPLHVIADLTPPVGPAGGDDPLHSVVAEPLDGSLWTESAQGWVRTADGRAEWRTILTTADTVPHHPTATHLGVVVGEAAVAAHGNDTRHLGGTLARARQTAIDGMTRHAVVRGAHAVVAVAIAYTAFAGTLLITATGTAITLTPRTEPGSTK